MAKRELFITVTSGGILSTFSHYLMLELAKLEEGFGVGTLVDSTEVTFGFLTLHGSDLAVDAEGALIAGSITHFDFDDGDLAYSATVTKPLDAATLYDKAQDVTVGDGGDPFDALPPRPDPEAFLKYLAPGGGEISGFTEATDDESMPKGPWTWTGSNEDDYFKVTRGNLTLDGSGQNGLRNTLGDALGFGKKVKVNVAEGTAKLKGEKKTVTFTGFEDFFLSEKGDKFTGSDNSEIVFGNDGDDKIKTGGGPDTLEGGDGDDTLKSGDGDDDLDGQRDNDTLDGGTGDDTYTGGGGDDVFKIKVYSGSTDTDTITDFNQNGDTDKLVITVEDEGVTPTYAISGSDFQLMFGGATIQLNDTTPDDFIDDFKFKFKTPDTNWSAKNDVKKHKGTNKDDMLFGGKKMDGKKGDDTLHFRDDIKEAKGGKGADNFEIDGAADSTRDTVKITDFSSKDEVFVSAGTYTLTRDSKGDILFDLLTGADVVLKGTSDWDFADVTITEL